MTNCIDVLTKYSNYNLQEKIDHIEEMEESRKICLAALVKSQDKIKHQPSREIVRMLITQLENKQLEEQIFKLKQEAEKEEKEKQHTSPVAEFPTKNEFSTENEQHTRKTKNDKDLLASTKTAIPNKPEQPLTTKKHMTPSTKPSSVAGKSQQTKNQKWEGNQGTETSAQNPVKQINEPKRKPEESQTNSINTGPIKACITSLFNHPNEHSESCSTALNQLIENNISEKRITPTYILVRNSGVPILISETNPETTQTTKCNKNGAYNETLKEPVDKEGLMYRLLAHLNQVTNL